MIIVCSGCSFTHGHELWEEKNIPNYLNRSEEDAISLANISYKDPKNELERCKLTYTRSLKRILHYEVFNIGVNGICQQNIMITTITKLNELRKQYPNEKIICIMQDTLPFRVFLYSRKYDRNHSIVLSNTIPERAFSELEQYEIVDIYMKYIPDELVFSEYYMNGLAVQNYCFSHNIEFLRFQIKDACEMGYSPAAENNSLIDMNLLMNEYYNPEYSIQKTMHDRLYEYFGNESFYLPANHFNCESHKLMGKWIAEELQQRNLV